MKMKKMLAIVSALCMVCAVVPMLPISETAVISASAEDTEYTYENFKYKKYEDYIEITGYVEEPAGELIIPAEIDGLPVISIGVKAFYECKNITSIMLPDTITTTESSVFWCDTALKLLVASTNQADMKGMAFANCTALKEIHVSDTHPTFSSEDGVLFNKDKTELIRYPVGKTGESYTIPDSVKNIAQHAFLGCTELKSVVIPDGVTEIGRSAFGGCLNLASFTLPKSISSIEMSAFEKTSWLNQQQEQNSLIFINDILIDGTTCKGDIVIPDNTRVIGDGAFYSCSDLTSVTIPESVTEIGYNAFSRCSALTSVTIPESVKSIGTSAFSFCTSLASVTIKNPNCIIPDSFYTISNGTEEKGRKILFDGTIYGYEGSTAQAYAEQYSRNFASLGSAPDSTEPKTETFKQGDADESGEIDILDVITMNKAILGKENLTENGLKAIDFNSNGKPDAGEAQTLLKYIVGLITEFTE